MHNAPSVIARLPYPMTQPKHLAVASEVATIDLVRSHGVPAPRVFGYSADASNSVGAEYILMEKAPGRPLGDAWFGLSEKQRIKVLSGIVDIEARLFAIDLPTNGSVFYGKDLPSSTERKPLSALTDPEQKMCIGPDVSLKFWFEERETLNIRRQPCKSLSPLSPLSRHS